MLINIAVIPRAKKQEVIKLGDGKLKIKLVSPPEKNKANKELINILAQFYRVKRSDVRIIRGYHARDKIVEIIT